MQQPQVIEAINRNSMTGLQIGVILICWLINMLDGFDVLAIAYTAPTITEEWGLAPQQLGVVLSAGLVGMAIGAITIAPLADRFGRRSIILWSLLLIGVAMVATAAASSITGLVVARVVTGLGVGGLLASLNTMVAEYASDRRRHFSISFLQSGYPIGALVGGLIAAPLIPRYGWEMVFIAGGVVTLLMVLVVYWMMPESLHYLLERQPAKAISRINQIAQRLQQAPVAELPPRQEIAESGRLTDILAQGLRRPSLLLWSSFFMSMLTLYFLLLWTPQIIVNAGLPKAQGILVGAMLNGGGLLGMLLLGHFSARFGLYRLIKLFFLLGTLAMIAFALLPAGVTLLLVLSFILGFFTIGGMIGLYSAAAGIYPTSLRNTGLGWGIGIGRFGAILGPNVAGILIGMGWQQSHYYLLLALPLLFAMVLVHYLDRAQSAAD